MPVELPLAGIPFHRAIPYVFLQAVCSREQLQTCYCCSKRETKRRLFVIQTVILKRSVQLSQFSFRHKGEISLMLLSAFTEKKRRLSFVSRSLTNDKAVADNNRHFYRATETNIRKVKHSRISADDRHHQNRNIVTTCYCSNFLKEWPVKTFRK